MKIIEQSITLYDPPAYTDMLCKIETAARHCYQSSSIGKSEEFIKRLIKRGHESPLEHCSLTFKITTDRAVLAELSRHRILSLQVESQRYVKYDEVIFIKPVWLTEEGQAWNIFKVSCQEAEQNYLNLIKICNKKPQEARIVLTNATKCDIICTTNIREWRYIFKLRTTPENNPQFREIMLDGLNKVKEMYPVFFNDIGCGEVEQVVSLTGCNPVVSGCGGSIPPLSTKLWQGSLRASRH